MKKTLLLSKYYFFNTCLFLSLLMLPKSLQAQLQLPNDLRPNYVPDIAGANAEEKIYTFTGSLIITIMQVVGGVAIILIIFNGFKYTIARGEESELEQSKTNLLWIGGGLILMMVAYVVIRFVVRVTLIVDEL